MIIQALVMITVTVSGHNCNIKIFGIQLDKLFFDWCSCRSRVLLIIKLFTVFLWDPTLPRVNLWNTFYLYSNQTSSVLLKKNRLAVELGSSTTFCSVYIRLHLSLSLTQIYSTYYFYTGSF